MAEHPVERHRDLADLGARVGVRDPVGQRDLTAGQRQLGHPGRSRRHPPQRPQRQPHEPQADEPGQDQRGQERRQLSHLDLVQRRFHGGKREAGDQHVTVPAPDRGEPVVTVNGVQVLGVVPAIGRQPGHGRLVGGGQVALPVDDALIGHHPVLHPGPERPGVQARGLVAVAGRGALGQRRALVMPGLHAGGVPPARRLELVIELVEQGVADHDVGDEAHASAGQGEQGHQPGDELAAQRAGRQPAGRPRPPRNAGSGHQPASRAPSGRRARRPRGARCLPRCPHAQHYRRPGWAEGLVTFCVASQGPGGRRPGRRGRWAPAAARGRAEG